MNANEMIIDVLGKNNDYLNKLLSKMINEEYNNNIYSDGNLKNIEIELQEKIEELKKELNGDTSMLTKAQLIISSVLKEKIKDRSRINNEKKKKYILIIISVAVPIITNLIQFGVNYQFKK